MDILKECFPSLSKPEAGADKFHEFMSGVGTVVICQPYMAIIVDRNGKIKDTIYYANDVSQGMKFMTYNSVKEFRKFYEDAKAAYDLNNDI